jgi:arylsulfatase A-like enzyme
VAGLVFGGWWVFLGRDFSHSLVRLGTLRLAFCALAGAVAGLALSILLHLLLGFLGRKSARLLTLGSVLLAILYLIVVPLAAFSRRATLLPWHLYSPLPLTLGVAAVVATLSGALLFWRVREALVAAQSRHSRRYWLEAIGWGLALLSLLTLTVVSRLPLAAGATGRPIIVLSLDTMRGDRLGALGYPKPLTPHLDALAREGVLFEQATSTAPWTLPSHASIFTSLLPFDHGSTRETRPLRPSLSMLAERLRNAGYRTAAFTGGAYVSSGFGFGQGFEIYEDHDEGREEGAGRIATAALKWVRSVKDQPFFVFVHTYEIHFPYTHTEFAEKSFLDQGMKPLDVEQLAALHAGKLTVTPDQRQFERELYDGDVARADLVMGGMLYQLRQEGILDRAILVVLSDHGDELWDHDDYWSPGHGHSLYQELVHVPLIVRAPGLVRAGDRIRTPVSLLDVLPTLLAWAGIPGEPEDEGRSLVAALSRGIEPEPVPMNAEATEYGPERFARRAGNLKAIITPKPDALQGGIDRHYRPLEVFDLQSDPYEQHDLSASLPPEASVLIEDLWKRVERVWQRGSQGNTSGPIPKELEEQLRSLGYVR